MDITTINNIWRPIYAMLLMGVRQLTPEWQDLKMVRDFTSLSPRSINWPVVLVNGGGMAWTSDGGSTARASSNEPPEAQDTWSHLTGRFEVGFDVKRGSKNMNAQAIKKQLAFQAEDKLRSFMRAIAIGYYGYPSGVICRATGSDTANPTGTQTRFEVDDLYTVGGDIASRIRLRDYFTPGKDHVNVYQASAATKRNTGTGHSAASVVSIDESNNRLTVDSGTAFNGAISNNDRVVLANHIDGSSDDLGNAINGLLHLNLSTTVHNISGTTYPDWNPAVKETSYEKTLAPADLYKWFEYVEQRSMYPVKWVRTTTGVLAAAGGGEIDQRRYTATDDNMRVGFKSVMVNGVTVTGRPYCPHGTLFLGSNEAIGKIAPDNDVRKVVNSGDDGDGFQQYQNTLGFYKDQVLRCQIVARSRLGLGVVQSISEV